MIPDWRDEYGVPSVDDSVCIAHNFTITVDCNRSQPDSLRVSVQPRTKTGTLSEHGRSIAALLRSTHAETARFVETFLRPDITPEELDSLRVGLKSLLENHRSALEYVAHHIAGVCTPKPPSEKVQFPVAKPSDSAATFTPKLDQWFPGLQVSAPKVRDYLLSIQEFNGGIWLRQLADLTNFNKHRSLSAQETGDYLSVVIRFGDAGIRIGELGLQSLTLEVGGTLRFVNSAGQQADLTGPYAIDANNLSSTVSPVGMDPRIEIVNEKRHLYRVPGFKKSTANVLWIINRNVLCVVHRVCALLS